MKKVILLMLLTFGFSGTAEAQVYKFKTTGFSVFTRGKWSDFQKSSMVITLDTQKDRIVVYSQEIQLYRIITYAPKEEDENNLIYPFVCEDDDGQRFTISIITRKNQGNRKQMYINQKEFVIAYNIENME